MWVIFSLSTLGTACNRIRPMLGNGETPLCTPVLHISAAQALPTWTFISNDGSVLTYFAMVLRCLVLKLWWCLALQEEWRRWCRAVVKWLRLRLSVWAGCYPGEGIYHWSLCYSLRLRCLPSEALAAKKPETHSLASQISYGRISIARYRKWWISMAFFNVQRRFSCQICLPADHGNFLACGCFSRNRMSISRIGTHTAYSRLFIE